MFRKFLASCLVFLFVIAAIPNFFIFSLSKTFLDTDFYRKPELMDGVYLFMVDQTVQALQKEGGAMKGYFKEEKLNEQVSKVFTKKVFTDVLNDFANQVDAYKKDQTKPLKLSLKLLRENMLTVANNLTYMIYQDLPACAVATLPKFNAESGMPECIPPGANYDQVVKPVLDNFEASVYNSIPEELSNLEQATGLKLVVEAENYRNISFTVLLVLIALITLLVWRPLSAIVAYLGVAFLASGVIGVGMSNVLSNFVQYANVKTDSPEVLSFMNFLMHFVGDEMSRLSWLFIVVGIAMFVIKMVIKRTVDSNKLAN